MLREAPAKVLGDFKAECLGAFRVEGTQVDVDEAPAIFERHLRTQSIHFVVGAGDADDLGAVDAGAEDFGSAPGRPG